MTRQTFKPLAFLVAVTILAVVGQEASAVSYASGVRNTGGTNYEFVLNAPGTVTVQRTGSSALSLGALPAGRHTFSAPGAFEIEVASNFTKHQRLSDETNLFTNFGRPNGIAVNRNPADPYFGTVYVAQGNATATVPVVGPPAIPSRTMADGIYALTADLIGLDVPNFAPVADPQSTAFRARPASWTDGSSNSPYRITLDASGNIIVADWGDAAGGIKYVNKNFSGGGQILGGQGGPSPSTTTNVGGGFAGSNHGSIASQVTVTGTVGVDLTVWAIDEDLAVASNGVGGAAGLGSATDGNSLWRWNVGAATDYTAPGQVVIDSNLVPLASDSARTYLNLNVGVLADAVFSPVHNKWYLTQNRSGGNESGLAVLTAGAAGASTLDFSSRDWTLANGYDGYPGEFDFIPSDILRNIGSVDISADGTKLLLHRIVVDPTTDVGGFNQTNPLLGQQSNLPGAVLVVPLDANGIPIITIDDNGTVNDLTDDKISNWESINIIGNNTTHVRAEIEFDAAGNIYTGNNNSELIEVYSAGGSKKATTRSNGTFSVVDFMAPSLPGDANADGKVDLLDLDILGANFGTTTGATVATGDFNADGGVDLLDLDILGANFGSMLMPGVAIPEPTAAGLAAAAVGAMLARRRR